MSAAEVWLIVAVVLGFFSALVALIGPPTLPPVVVKLGAAALAAAVACTAAGWFVFLP
jgi:hypothetical protein